MTSSLSLHAVQVEVSRRACERSLLEFVRQAWPVIEPGAPFVEGWHIATICDHLAAVTSGQIRRLLINVPPRSCKSTLVSCLWPAWEWTTRPEEQFLTASYSATLSTRDAVKTRRLIQSPWYQARWGKRFTLAGDQNAKMRYENDQSGYRIATSVGGTATGEGGSRLLCDDPLSAADAQSDALRQTALDWWDMTWSTRLNDPQTSAMVTIMQRLHTDDIAGHILEQGGTEHVCLPMEWDAVPRRTILGRYDPRKNHAELLWPERFGAPEVSRLKMMLGEYGAAGQLQQVPAPPGGGIIKTKLIRLWPNNKPLPPMQYILQSYDTAFTKDTDNDPTACTVWGIFWHEGKNHAMLVDCWEDHLDYPALKARVISHWKAKYAGSATDPANKSRRPDLALIEKKGSGLSLIQDLAGAGVRIAPYNPGLADKIARAHVITPILEAGLVWVREGKTGDCWPSWAQWLERQLQQFPRGKHDDGCDTLTQGLRYLKDAGFLKLTVSDREKDEERPPQPKRVNVYAE